MKKIITLVTGIAIILGTSTVCFADAQTTTNQDSQKSTQNIIPQVGIQIGNTVNLTLDDAINNIEKVNPDIKIRDAKLKLLEVQYNHDKSVSIVPDADPGTLSYDMQSIYTWNESLNTLNNEKRDRDDKVKSLKIDLQKQYLNAVSDRQDLESIGAEMANLDKNIEKVTLKVNLGQANKTELDSLNAEKSNLQAKLNTVEAQLETELLTLRQYLNISLNKEIRLVPIKKEFVKFDETAIETRLENALKKNYALKKIENSIGLSKSKRSLYMSYANNETSVRNMNISISQTQETYEETKLATQISLMKSYYDLKNKEDAVEAEKLNLEIAQDSFNTAETKFNSGTIGKIDLETARISLEEQKTKLERAINDYMVTSQSFKNMLEEDQSSEDIKEVEKDIEVVENK